MEADKVRECREHRHVVACKLRDLQKMLVELRVPQRMIDLDSVLEDLEKLDGFLDCLRVYKIDLPTTPN